MIARIETFILDSKYALYLLGFLLVALVMGCLVAAIHDVSACKAQGGHMVGTGQYYPVTSMVGQVPVTTMIEEQTCSVQG